MVVLEMEKRNHTMTKFSVPDMTCGHCKATVEKAIWGLDAGAGIEVDLEQHVLAVNSTTAGEQPILSALKEAGYEATVL